jgi:hypothetical protein
MIVGVVLLVGRAVELSGGVVAVLVARMLLGRLITVQGRKRYIISYLVVVELAS